MEKNKHAQALGRLGGLKSAKMTKEKREKIMRPVWDKTKERWAKLRADKGKASVSLAPEVNETKK